MLLDKTEFLSELWWYLLKISWVQKENNNNNQY